MKRTHPWDDQDDQDDQEVDPSTQPKVVYRIKGDIEGKHTIEILDIHDILKEEEVLLQALTPVQARKQIMRGGLRCAHQHGMTYAHHKTTPHFKHMPSHDEGIASKINSCTCLQKGDKVMNSTIHLEAQRALTDHINNKGTGAESPIIFRAWKDCKQAMCSIDVETITPQDSSAEMETRGGINVITGKMMQFDILVRTVDRATGKCSTLAIEVYNTHRTDPRDRQGVKYIEVCAQEILKWRESGHKKAIVLEYTNIDTRCQKCEERAQKRAEQQARLEEERRIRLAEEREARLEEEQWIRLAEEQRIRLAEEQRIRLAEERRIRLAEESKKKAEDKKKAEEREARREKERTILLAEEKRQAEEKQKRAKLARAEEQRKERGKEHLKKKEAIQLHTEQQEEIKKRQALLGVWVTPLDLLQMVKIRKMTPKRSAL